MEDIMLIRKLTLLLVIAPEDRLSLFQQFARGDPLRGDDILKRAIKRYGPTKMFVRGRLHFCQTATKAIGIV